MWLAMHPLVQDAVEIGALCRMDPVEVLAESDPRRRLLRRAALFSTYLTG